MGRVNLGIAVGADSIGPLLVGPDKENVLRSRGCHRSPTPRNGGRRIHSTPASIAPAVRRAIETARPRDGILSGVGAASSGTPMAPRQRQGGRGFPRTRE